MQYFVSWTHSDPIFPAFFPDVRLLISPPNVNQVWQVRDWPHLPAHLLLDSGAFQYHREQRIIDPAFALERQLHLAADLDLPVGLCHLDTLVRGASNSAEIERRIVQNLTHARWLIDHVQAAGLPQRLYPIGVIQGASVEHVYTVARTLADLGYTRFALGSLASMVANARDAVLRRVEAALEAVGPQVHVLGVSSVALLSELAHTGITSVDSGAPLHEAWRGGLFYSEPFRRFKIDSPYFREWSRTYSFAEVLEEPLPCDCPVCREDASRLLHRTGKRFINLRSLHNYYHLRRALEAAPPLLCP